VKKVLITGGGGFIGRQTFEPLLARGFEIHCVGRDLKPDNASHVTYHSCNLLDNSARAALVEAVGATHLLHLAWVTAHGKFWAAPENLDWVKASIELAQNFLDAGGKRAVFAGTCAEYDWSDGRMLEDQTLLRPATLYGKSKNSLRESLAALCPQIGLSWAWGRIFFLYGPHEGPNRLVASVILSLLRGERARCSDGEQIRDLLHVADVAQGFVVLLDSDFDGAVNIASGEEFKIREVVSLISEKLNQKGLLDFGAIPRSANDPARIAADCTRLKSLGWNPHFNLDTGLDDAIAWWRTQEN
jgi:nucleoside-diphosphate-sugar epimerase